MKSVLLQGAILIIGIGTLLMISHGIVAILLAIAGAIVYPQIVRRFEYEANAFAVARMDHPKKLKTLYAKAKKSWKEKGASEDTSIHKLFNIWHLGIYTDLMKSVR